MGTTGGAQLTQLSYGRGSGRGGSKSAHPIFKELSQQKISEAQGVPLGRCCLLPPRCPGGSISPAALPGPQTQNEGWFMFISDSWIYDLIQCHTKSDKVHGRNPLIKPMASSWPCLGRARTWGVYWKKAEFSTGSKMTGCR